MSNAPDMDDVDQGHPEVDRIRTLAEQAARLQDILGDLEVALVHGGETPAMRLLGELKRAWRDFKDEAMRSGSMAASGGDAP